MKKYKTPKKKTVMNYRRRITSLETEVQRLKWRIRMQNDQLKTAGVTEYQHALDQQQIMALRRQIIALHSTAVA
jgi:predicted  nucleic acid-binding Zn-ribbon protein